MERYWIRNRGRVQGPFNIDRIQGLMRRGRFNRHFHVSEDKKNWLPALDFPELFDGVTPSRGGGGGDDEDVFQGGGSPFDDDLDAAPKRSGGSSGSRRTAFDADDDDDEDEDWEDDEDDWEDDDSGGALSGLVSWIEAYTKPLVILLVLVLAGLGWFVFGKESFAQDKVDLEVLIDVNSRVTSAFKTGGDANAWTMLDDQIKQELAPLVERLEDTASAKDNIKQELLFAARDDIPRMFRELPQGSELAAKRIQLRFSKIDRMISKQTRIDDMQQLPTAPAAASNPPPAEATPVYGENTTSEAEAIPGRPGAPPTPVTPPGVETVPAADPASSNGGSTPQQMQPTDTAPTSPNTPTPNATPSSSSGNATNNVPQAGGIPGRPSPKN